MGRIFEVTSEGKICFEYIVEDFADYKGLEAKELEGVFDYKANAVFRAYKYTPEEVPWLAEKLKAKEKEQGKKKRFSLW